MLPRDFFIEERLEKYRKVIPCNMGESGLRNFKVREIIGLCDLDIENFLEISLEDSPNNGRYDLREQIANLYDNIFPDNILLTTGTSEALYLFFRIMVKPKNVIGYFSPAFQALYEIPDICGAILNPVNILEGKNFEKLFSKSDIIILNHPHNPTGIVFTKSDWEEISYLNQKYNRIILFDEHYRFLDYRENIGRSGLDMIQGNVYATGSITKSFGVTGLRIGWIIGNRNFLKEARSYKDYLTHTVNPISEYLAFELIKKKDKILPEIKTRVFNNIQIFKEVIPFLKSINSGALPEGGLVSFPSINHPSSENFSDLLLKKCDIFVLPGTNFEEEGHIRIGFGETNERFRSGVERWKEWEFYL